MLIPQSGGLVYEYLARNQPLRPRRHQRHRRQPPAGLQRPPEPAQEQPDPDGRRRLQRQRRAFDVPARRPARVGRQLDRPARHARRRREVPDAGRGAGRRPVQHGGQPDGGDAVDGDRQRHERVDERVVEEERGDVPAAVGGVRAGRRAWCLCFCVVSVILVLIAWWAFEKHWFF